MPAISELQSDTTEQDPRQPVEWQGPAFSDSAQAISGSARMPIALWACSNMAWVLAGKGSRREARQGACTIAATSASGLTSLALASNGAWARPLARWRVWRRHARAAQGFLARALPARGGKVFR